MSKESEILEADRKHHDKVAPGYDDWFVNPLQYVLLHAELVEQVTRVFAPDGGTLVEIGAGTGAMALPLSRKGYDILAVDTSDGMLARLKDKCPAIRTLNADASSVLPIEPQSVGCVLISQALHHIPDKTGVIVEARRILRPGGMLCIFEPQLLPAALDFIRRFARRRCCPGDHLSSEAPIDPAGLRKLVASLGFRPVRCGTTFFLPFDAKSRLGAWLVRKLWKVPGRIPLVRRLGGVYKICSRKEAPAGSSAPSGA
jgi:SAM-dependent methyltransferase